MNTMDLVLTGFFILGTFYGYYKGFVKQAVGLLSLVVSLLVAYSFSKHTAVFLQEQFPLPNEQLPSLLQTLLEFFSLHHLLYTVISFILLFILTRFLWKFIGGLLSTFAELPIISLFNRLLGACLGSLQAILVMIIGVNLLTAMPEGKWKEAVIYNSVVSTYILEFSPLITERWEGPPKLPKPQPSDMNRL